MEEAELNYELREDAEWRAVSAEEYRTHREAERRVRLGDHVIVHLNADDTEGGDYV